MGAKGVIPPNGRDWEGTPLPQPLHPAATKWKTPENFEHFKCFGCILVHTDPPIFNFYALEKWKMRLFWLTKCIVSRL